MKRQLIERPNGKGTRGTTCLNNTALGAKKTSGASKGMPPARNRCRRRHGVSHCLAADTARAAGTAQPPQKRLEGRARAPEGPGEGSAYCFGGHRLIAKSHHHQSHGKAAYLGEAGQRRHAARPQRGSARIK